MRQLIPELSSVLHLRTLLEGLSKLVVATVGEDSTVSGDIQKTVISEEWLTPDCVLREEDWMAIWTGQTQPVRMRICYTKDGKYIGEEKDGRYLVLDRGIVPEINRPDHSVCSIGFCPKENKWYGWSHRAIFGFGIGDEFYHADTCFGGPGSMQPKQIIQTMDEARQSACNFAEDVS